jgi:hypothetical protein
LNPHDLAMASTSNYSSYSERHYFNDLTGESESNHVLSYAALGTNTSHDEPMPAQLPSITEMDAPAESLRRRRESAKDRYAKAYSQPIRIRGAGWEFSRRVPRRGVSVRIRTFEDLVDPASCKPR